MNVFMRKQLQPIVSKHNLELIKSISYNAYLCKQGDVQVVLKIGKNVTYERSKRTKYILDWLQNQTLKRIVVPAFVAMSDQDDKEQYIITSYQEATELPWSEFDDEPDWGGRDISLKHIEDVLIALADLEKLDSKTIDLHLDKEQFTKAQETLGHLQSKKLITEEVREKVTDFIDKQSGGYFDKNITVSNGDFYPKNLMITPNGRPYLIDWDGAQLNAKEQVMMYFWASMFGNPEFQKQLLDEYKKRDDWDQMRFQLGLILATTEDLGGWMHEPECSKATQKYCDYLKNFDSLVS